MQLIREGVQVASLIGALSAHEITLGEFSDSLRMLTAEAIEVLTATLQWAMVDCEVPEAHLVAARTVALQIGANRRSLS